VPPVPAGAAATAATPASAAPAPTTAAVQPPPGATTAAPAPAPEAGGSASTPGELIDAIKLTAADLPTGFSLGALAGEQPNAQAVSGYADP
jgi:hypothetical protein